MKKFALAIATISLLFTGVASAADMAPRVYTKAPPPIVAVYNWTGFYVGGNVGGMWTDESAFWPNRAPGLIGTFSHDESTGIGGVHAGAQYQWNNLVFGAEVAWWTRFNGGEVTGSPNTGCPNVAFTCQASVSDVWTIGPRIGLAYNDWMFYGTGGYANGKIATRSFAVATGAVFDDFSNRHGGWFAGVGVEYAVWKWTSTALILGVEYQHVDLGTTVMASPADGGVFGVDGRNIDTTIDLVRARASVKFNPAGP